MSVTALGVLAGNVPVSTAGECSAGSIPLYNADGSLPQSAPSKPATGLGGVVSRPNLWDGRSDDGTVLDTVGGTANQVVSIPFVDSSGSGTFKITVEGVTSAITYSATAATLVGNINTALNTALGTSAVVASGATLAAIILTFSGNAYASRPVGPTFANVVAGSTGYTINGVGTVATNSLCVVTTQGSAVSGRFKISNTTGTSMALTSEGAKNNTKTDKVDFLWTVPQFYSAGSNITVTVNAQSTANGGTISAQTVLAGAYLMTDAGLSGANLVATSAATTTSSAADYTFTITGTTLTPGSRVLIQLTAAVTENANAGTGSTIQINSVRMS